MGYFKLNEDNKVVPTEQHEVGALFMDDEKLTDTFKSQEWTPSKGYIDKLNSTDWKVLRHKDQLELGVDTSLTSEEYTELLTKRQEWRTLHSQLNL